MSKALARAPIVAFLLLCCATLFAQEFSAVMVETHEDQPSPPRKIFVGKTMVRFESGDRDEAGILLYDMTQRHSIVLMPQRHMYMEMGQGRELPRASVFFRPENVENACPEWQRAAAELSHKPMRECHKVGDDTVNGRAAIKYAGTSDDGDQGYAWIDRSLRFVIKWQSKKGGVEMREIKEGSQPASLFEIPSDYQKFDMNMMRNMHPQEPPQR